MSNVERLIEETGGCGLFQFLHVVSTHLCFVIAVWGVNMMAFGNYDPGWMCLEDGQRLPMLASNTSVSKTEKQHYNWNTSSCWYNQTCSSIQFNPHGKTIVTEWDLICNKDWIPSLMISLQMTGQLLGSIVAGYVSENNGRKLCVIGNVLIFAMANLAATFSTSWQMFTALRFVIGLGVGGLMSSSFVYAIEFLNPRWRGIVGGLPIVNTGLLIFSVVVYFERDWRWVHLTTAIAACVILLTSFWVSESIRWLTVHGRGDKAKEIVVRIARYNRTAVPNMDIIDVTSAEKNSNDNDKIYSYLDLFRYKKIRPITIKISIMWFFNVIVYYSLTFSVEALPGDFYRNFIIFSASEIPAVFFTVPIMNCVGRIKSGATFFGFAGLACGAAAVVSTCNWSSDYDLVIVLLTMLAKGVVAGGRSIVRICAGELMPTTVRALSYSFFQVISRTGGIIAPYFIPGTVLSLNVFLSIQTALLCLCSALFLTLPESKDKEMSDLIEGESPGKQFYASIGNVVPVIECKHKLTKSETDSRAEFYYSVGDAEREKLLPTKSRHYST